MVEHFEENSHDFLINTFHPLIAVAEQRPQGDFELFGWIFHSVAELICSFLVYLLKCGLMEKGLRML